MRATPNVTLQDVEVIGDTGLALHCVHGGKDVWVGHDQLLPGSTIRKVGDRGVLVIPAWLAATVHWNRPTPPTKSGS
jgi:hypothetical protein